MSRQMMGTPQNGEDRLDEAGIPPMQLHHIAFKTARILEMREFYRTFLGVHLVLAHLSTALTISCGCTSV